MTIVEKAAYLKGLAEGMGLDPELGEGRLWAVLTELMGDIAHTLEEHENGLEAQEESLDDVYEQLIYLQEITLPTEELTDYDDDEDEDDEEEAIPETTGVAIEVPDHVAYLLFGSVEVI